MLSLVFLVTFWIKERRFEFFRSFVPVPEGSHFPIQNLPFGTFRRPGMEGARAGIAIGEHVLDLAVLESRGLLGDLAGAAVAPGPLFARPSLNAFAS